MGFGKIYLLVHNCIKLQEIQQFIVTSTTLSFNYY